MRFLIGIIIGAVLTLFIATAVDAPTHSTLSRVLYHLEQAWDGLISSTSDSLFKIEQGVDAAGQRETPKLSEPALRPEPDVTFLPELRLQQERLPQEEFHERLDGSLAVNKLLNDTAAEIPAAALTAPASVPPAPSFQIGKDTAAERTEDTLRPDTTSDYLSPALASVWTPFHSQMSAEGFATRLSRQLDHSFQVERQGAGAYQVVFSATSSAERDQLLAQIAEITGQ